MINKNKIVILSLILIIVLSGCGIKNEVLSSENYDTVKMSLNANEYELFCFGESLLAYEPDLIYTKTAKEVIKTGKIFKELPEETKVYEAKLHAEEWFNDVFWGINSIMVFGHELSEIDNVFILSEKLKKEKVAYDMFIESLNSSDYIEIKLMWDKINEEIENLYKDMELKYENNKIRDYGLYCDRSNLIPTDKLEEYIEEFEELRKELW